MSDGHEPIQQQIERYLDGMLSPDEARAFEEAIAADDALHAEVELQARIDESLARTFKLPEDVALPSKGARPANRLPLLKVFGAIAAVLFVGGLAWYGVIRPSLPPPVRPPAPEQFIAAETVYNLMRNKQFEPEWRCETDAEFIEAVEDRLGAPALVQEDLPALAVVGWAYTDTGIYRIPNIITSRTMILICRLDENDVVLVFVDRLDRDRPPKRRSESDLNLFRRELGDLVLYELTPRDAAEVIDRFTIPESAAP